MIGGWGGEGRGRSLQLDCYTEEILSGRNHIGIGCCSDKGFWFCMMEHGEAANSITLHFALRVNNVGGLHFLVVHVKFLWDNDWICIG